MYRIAFIHSPMDHSYHMKEAAQLLKKEESLEKLRALYLEIEGDMETFSE